MVTDGLADAARELADAVEHLAAAAGEYALRAQKSSRRCALLCDRQRLADALEAAGQATMLARLAEVRLAAAVERRAAGVAALSAALGASPVLVERALRRGRR